MASSQEQSYERTSSLKQLKDLAAERSLEIEYKFLKPPGYLFKLGCKVREGDFLVHCFLTGRDFPTQKFVGEGDLPYEAKREAAIKAKAFLTQGSQGHGNGLAKKDSLLPQTATSDKSESSKVKTDESKELLCLLDKFQEEIKSSVGVLNDVKNEAFRKQITAKGDLLERQRLLATNFVRSRKEEIAMLTTGVEEARNLKTMKHQELDRLNLERAQIVKECEDKDEVVEHLTQKKRKLEESIPENINAFKEVIGKLEQELNDLKSKHEDKKQKTEEQVVVGPNLVLLNYISKKIEAKEGMLECPVCFEVASAPIFMCSSEHLVCSACRTKVSRCPECRKVYTIERRRHRFAEQAAEELEVLYRERAEVLQD